MQEVPRMTLPEDQRELLAAFGRFLRGHMETMSAASGQLGDGPAAFLLYAMFVHQIQLGRALQEICIGGHAQEGQMIARALVGGALDILLVAEADSHSRALLYVTYESRVRQERARVLVKHGHMTQQDADAREAKAVAEETAKSAAHAAAGQTPAAKLGRWPTWSGLTDQGLATRFNKEGWYDLFYSPFSDTAHTNVAAIADEIVQISQGNITIGGRFDNPWLVVVTATETISHSSEALDRFFGLGKVADLEAIDKDMLTGLGKSAAAARRRAGT